MDSLQMLLFGYLPQMILSSYAGIALLGFRIRAKTAIIIGLVISIVDLLIKALIEFLYLPFGLHVLVSIVVLAVALRIGADVNWGVATGGSFLSYIMITVGEALFANYFLQLLGISIGDVRNLGIKDILLLSITSSIPLVLATIFCHYKKFSLVNLAERNSARGEEVK